MKEKTIWVVDDDPIYQIIMKKIILKSGFFSSNFSFPNGKEAIDSLKKIIISNGKFPDIILLDIEMPILDGWGFMEEMDILKSRINNEIQIYISSSSIAVEDKERAQNNSGILGYMSKPISLNDLIKIASV
ncbi:response regulator [Flavobacterium sufflavum]|uniref:Response regulator n=1 Tax=Flavobacterium sufflavum TaxID=1921138 RepID=A0A437KPM2_9FLAO|nr:response regulator [Flavobacterium sufflavum]RVT73355.1 response regulator [Flavobacterium sufflavum]